MGEGCQKTKWFMDGPLFMIKTFPKFVLTKYIVGISVKSSLIDCSIKIGSGIQGKGGYSDGLDRGPSHFGLWTGFLPAHQGPNLAHNISPTRPWPKIS